MICYVCVSCDMNLTAASYVLLASKTCCMYVCLYVWLGTFSIYIYPLIYLLYRSQGYGSCADEQSIDHQDSGVYFRINK